MIIQYFRYAAIVVLVIVVSLLSMPKSGSLLASTASGFNLNLPVKTDVSRLPLVSSKEFLSGLRLSTVNGTEEEKAGKAGDSSGLFSEYQNARLILTSA